MKLEPEVQEELEAIAQRCECELLHAEYRGGVFRLVLDRDSGVTVKECSGVSREVSAFLDVIDFGKGNYTLEVTSPGLDRELYKPDDYRRFVGSAVRITWLQEEKKRTDVGRLLSLDSAADTRPAIEIDLGDGIQRVELSAVLRTRLEPEF